MTRICTIPLAAAAKAIIGILGAIGDLYGIEHVVAKQLSDGIGVYVPNWKVSAR